MIKFFLKKNLCDIWDNVLFLLGPNFLISVLTILSFLATIKISALTKNLFVSYGVALIFFCLIMIFVFAWGENAKNISNFDAPKYKIFFRAIFPNAFHGFFFGLILSLLLICAAIAIPWYWKKFLHGNFFSLLICAAIAWFVLICLIALQWFIPLKFLQPYNTFKKCLKKSFIIFFDNPWFSVFIFLHNIFLFLISAILIFFVPGAAGILLSLMNALRLRLYKYDWWEENPDIASDPEKRYEVPWQKLLSRDIETLGPRKIGSFIFPWK